MNLSYFPVSFPESSTRDPYLGETLLWNEKSWIIFRLGHYFNRFRLINMRFWETFGTRRLECKAVNVHEIWAREGSKKKKIARLGRCFKGQQCRPAPTLEIKESTNTHGIKMDYWAQAHLFVSAPMLHARGGVAGFVHHSSHAVLGRLLQVLKAPGAPQSPSQRLKGSTPSLGHFLPSRST